MRSRYDYFPLLIPQSLDHCRRVNFHWIFLDILGGPYDVTGYDNWYTLAIG